MKEYREVNSIEKSLETTAPSMALMRKTYGVEKIEALMKLWLIDLNESLNLIRPLREHQIDEIAFTIVQDFPFITMADINLIFRKAKKGGYGQFYESISMPKVISWFNEYMEDRMNTAGDISRRKHHGYNVESNRSQKDRELRSNKKESELHAIKLEEHIKNITENEG